MSPVLPKASPSGTFTRLMNGLGIGVAVLYILWPKKHRAPGAVNLVKDAAEEQWQHRRWYLL